MEKGSWIKCSCTKLFVRNIWKSTKSVYLEFMNLEKANDKVDIVVLQNVFRIYKVKVKLVRSVRNFYEISEAFMRIARKEGKCSH